MTYKSPEDKLVAARRNYHEHKNETRDAKNARARKSYAAHREERKAAARAYRLANPEKVAATQAKYRANNVEAVRESKRKSDAVGYIRHREKRKEYGKKYNLLNREKILARQRAVYAAKRLNKVIKVRVKQPESVTKEKQRQRSRRWYHDNREKAKAYSRKYHAVHRDECIEKHKAYIEKIQQDPEKWAVFIQKQRAAIKKSKKPYYHKNKSKPAYYLRLRLHNRINHAVKAAGIKKSTNSVALTGCSPAELVAHLTSKFLPGMSWENRSLWHIDHKRPCSSFDLTDPEQQKACFHYSNLQPLWARDNLLKSDKLPEELAVARS